MTIQTLTPQEAMQAMQGGALLVDIRDSDEHARERISGASNVPLARIDTLCAEGRPVIFHCRSGMRTSSNADQLAKAAGGSSCYLLEGGIDGWRRAGLATMADRSQPLEIMRQVQIAAGLMVLAGTLLGAFVNSAFLILPAFVGSGLILAGATGWCGLAMLLRAMPWNRPAKA